ncbi:phosphoribosyl-AMP cyclohydrolase [Rhizomicrobium palustre]|uniref:Phosphoribosyl-AMP cyclohydrolase n=1 Tax=Rhizomicrobium palustre TaxID=189966 RepID=A0A846N4B7_9PROT|nr:phosphoribosyl-AMP cyclohydrolase [Rhizomicrobium palustre]NIK89937.1 phosphoribosyl-AMP cyclohydrolase [Rhizomicrobium palustre]
MTDTIDRQAFIDAVKFNADGLVPVIAQSHRTGEVLMMAWMNRQSLEETFATGHVTYWSRSRQSLWRKGETSGHLQRLVEAYVDCDGDTLLLKVDQIGPACHTGAPNCFFRKLSEPGE